MLGTGSEEVFVSAKNPLNLASWPLSCAASVPLVLALGAGCSGAMGCAPPRQPEDAATSGPLGPHDATSPAEPGPEASTASDAASQVESDAATCVADAHEPDDTPALAE